MLRMQHENIDQLFHGVVQNKHGHGEMIPLRFSNQQLVEYGRAERFRQRSLCPAGVCLDFTTDASSVNITYQIKHNVRGMAQFDIYLNGAFVHWVEIANSTTEGVVQYQIPEGTARIKRITIYLPHTVELMINEIRFSAGAMVEPVAKREKNLLCLGDSITQGMDAVRPSLTYPVQLARFLDMNLLNQGVGGYFFDKNSLDPSLSYRPDLVTVAYGTNDWKRHSNIQEFEKMCSEYLQCLVGYTDVPIYVLTPLWRVNSDEQRPNGTLADIRNSIRQICSDLPNITVIDGMDLVPQMKGFYTDGLHPTEEGFLCMSLGILKNFGAC